MFQSHDLHASLDKHRAKESLETVTEDRVHLLQLVSTQGTECVLWRNPAVEAARRHISEAQTGFSNQTSTEPIASSVWCPVTSARHCL